MSLKTRLLRTWDYVETIGQAKDRSEVEAGLLKVASDFGFTAIFGGIVPETGIDRPEIDAHILLQTVPAEWAERYDNERYVFRDPVVQRAKIDRQPFSWSDSYESCPCRQDVELIRGEASTFGLREGYVIPIALLDDSVSAVSFGGNHVEIGDEGRAALSFATNYAIGHLLQQKSEQARFSASLTSREFDCLAWAAEGKTDWEISVILGISKSTVVKHLLSARDKLGAVNKAHAIAMALRDRLIR